MRKENSPNIQRVLIVEDEAQTRRMIARALAKFWPKLQIAEASDGIQAIQQSESFLPQLVILDLMLPVKDGFQVLEAMKENKKLASTLVLGITAYNSPENIVKVLSQGAVSFLSKPFSPQELYHILSPYFGFASSEGRAASVQSALSNREKTKSPPPLANLATFLGLLLSTMQLSSSSQLLAQRGNKMEVQESQKKKFFPFQRIAVLPFESWNSYLSGETVSDYFIHYLHRNFPEITVVERGELKKILKEQFFTHTGAVNPETVAELGKILGVDAILIGKVNTLETIVGNRGAISMVARIVDVNSGAVLWSDSQTARLKPKWIQLDSSYKEPVEVAQLLMEKVALQSVEQLKEARFQFPEQKTLISRR